VAAAIASPGRGKTITPVDNASAAKNTNARAANPSTWPAG
jgi:hypothetical protein